MFDEKEYVDPEEPRVLTLEYRACRFEGNLYQRKQGGFDLFLFRDNSEFECLEIDKITWMRHQSPDGSLFVERFADQTIGRDLRKNVELTLAKWLEINLGLPLGGKYRCRWGTD